MHSVWQHAKCLLIVCEIWCCKGIIEYSKKIGKLFRGNTIKDECSRKHGFTGMKGSVVCIFEPTSKHEGVSFKKVSINVEWNVSDKKVEVFSREPTSGVSRNFSESGVNEHDIRSSEER